MHDILILTEPVELVGMLKSHKCTISYHWTVVGGMLKSQQMHDILILTEPVELVGAKITTQMRYLLTLNSGWEC
jgi:hypothetical protein